MRIRIFPIPGVLCAVILLFSAVVWAAGAIEYQNGKAAGAKKDYKNAAQLFTKAIESKELNNEALIDAYYSRGLAWFEIGDLNKALNDFTMTIKLNPRHSDAYYSRAFAWDYKGQPDKAIADFTKALEINPLDADSFYSRGNCWFDQNNQDKAIADYAQALKLRPDFADAYYNRAVAYYNKGDLESAVKDAKKALSLAPKNKTYHDLVAELEAKIKTLQ
jgi:tetratricopeptide (TPR) repeat protein